jgi:DNA-binding MarR family transcriptional regulator
MSKEIRKNAYKRRVPTNYRKELFKQLGVKQNKLNPYCRKEKNVEGWIKLYRKLLDNPIITKDGDYLSIWIYLLLNATHDKYDTTIGDKRVTLQKGQLVTGRKSISNRLHISESKVQRILKCFENEHQIEQHMNPQNRTITIVNWSEYQSSKQAFERRANR